MVSLPRLSAGEQPTLPFGQLRRRKRVEVHDVDELEWNESSLAILRRSTRSRVIRFLPGYKAF